jgi:hypothetical protein
MAIGFTIGWLLTLAAASLVLLSSRGESFMAWFWLSVYLRALWPAQRVCESLGWKWPLDGGILNFKTVALAVLTNSFILAFAVTIIRVFIHIRKKGIHE